jgi:hypothetical protein
MCWKCILRYGNILCTDGLEAETLQLEDGSTLVIQEIPKFLDGHTVQLEDGTTAFVHPSIKAGGNIVLEFI